jgi:predicted dehydrogenase
MIGIGVIGYGYWGPNLARNFLETPGAAVRSICDAGPPARAKAAARYPGVKTPADPRDLIEDPSVDAVVIATPVSTHFELASAAIKAGKHVLVTKPMTSTLDEASRLVDLAAAAGKVLQVDHTFVYTGAVRKMKQLIDEGALGEVLYYDSVRVNLGLFQRDVNVIWDLAPHDVSIIEYLVPDSPVAVSAHGVSHVRGQPENLAYVTLFYPNNLLAHVHVNWLAPVKIRQTLIGGSKRMIVYNDNEMSEKIKVYDRGVELTAVESAPEKIYQMLVSYRAGDMFSPKIDGAEALRVEAAHFIECISSGARPLTDGESGRRVVRVLEAASESMTTGRLVNLTP